MLISILIIWATHAKRLINIILGQITKNFKNAWVAPCVFSWRVKISSSLRDFKTEDFKINVSKFEDLKLTVLVLFFTSDILFHNNEDSKKAFHNLGFKIYLDAWYCPFSSYPILLLSQTLCKNINYLCTLYVFWSVLTRGWLEQENWGFVMRNIIF